MVLDVLILVVVIHSGVMFLALKRYIVTLTNNLLCHKNVNIISIAIKTIDNVKISCKSEINFMF